MARGIPKDPELAVPEPDRRSSGTMEDKRNIQIIEWEHLDKKKFYVFGVAMTMMIRVSMYPFTLIRTRLQVQKGKSLYHGTFDAFVKILRADGVAGLYRGFLVNTFTLFSGQCYVTTYELTRKFVADYSQSNTVKSLVAGGSASLVAQSITVPIDVVSQHLMMQRKGEKMGRFQVRGNLEGQGLIAFGQTKDIIRQILRADGLRGFYRGYVASLLTYIPNSAVWWPFYHFYAGGRQELYHPDLQTADGRRGALGPHEGPLRPNHLGYTLHHRHCGGLREPQETQPPARAGGLKTLVASGGQRAYGFTHSSGPG
ncbi:solute carrier family 25 member 44 isoform X3 [Onychomys torridus]|uniref:solute carrier family 25 member 44 isoform X3 n=1 Tax=Onychomys torridus TaxID=38674 RepID=UPI00167F98C1|nr:solute carrier family 25 member 44 isoform X3 [Onychomys torridus]